MATNCPSCHSENPETQKFCGECGTQLTSVDTPDESFTRTLETSADELPRGALFAGRYEIIENLGIGGMGKVYRVFDKKLEGEIALKLIKSEIASDSKMLERFRNEIKLARDIAHRNVCRMYELMDYEERHFISMEYVAGQDLKGLIRQTGKLAIETAISITKQICEGLSEAHRLGVVHRDLKPSNIMIDKFGNAKIMDFGIARSLKTKGITRAGAMIGTPEYISPEQVEGKEVDQLADIYSLGVILYEMVTGRVPFEGETALSVAHKHRYEAPQEPNRFNTQISDDLNNVIMKCLAKDKEQRFQAAEELRFELENIEKAIPTTDIGRPKRKAITSKELTVTFGLKKLLVPAVVIVALVIITVVIWQPWGKKVSAPLPSNKPSLAVVYFENNTGDENLDHWRKSIASLLITDLTQSKYLKVLGGDRLFEILNQLDQLEAETYSSEVLKEVAAQGEVNHILRGSYSKAGDIIRIDTVLQDADTGEPVATERVEGTGEESIFSLVDDLTIKVKMSLELTQEQIAGDFDSRIVDITSSSPEALKHYLEGWDYINMGEPRLSLQSLEKAVALDPDFAMAYLQMHYGYSQLGFRAESDKYLQKAFELSEQLPARERYSIRGVFHANLEGKTDKAIEAFETLLEFYPDDIDGNSNLGELYAGLEQWDKARERFEFLINNNVKSARVYYVLGDVYKMQGMFDKAIEVFEEYLNTFGENAFIRETIVRIYLLQGEYDLAQAELEKAISLDPTDLSRSFLNELQGDIFICKGDWALAEKEYHKMLESEEPTIQINSRYKLAHLHILRGKLGKAQTQIMRLSEVANKSGHLLVESRAHMIQSYRHLFSKNGEKALEECNKAWKIAVDDESLINQIYALHLKGLISLTMNSVDEAERTADELKGMIESEPNQKVMRFYYHLAGEIELERKNFDLAIEHFKKALSLLAIGDFNQSFVSASFAQAYYESGDLMKSQETFEELISQPMSILQIPEVYVSSFFMLGKIHEEQGDKVKAIENYEKFLDLWKDADPGIAEVEDARERLAELLKSP